MTSVKQKLDLSKITYASYVKGITDTYVISVTPEIASKWLELNTTNRSVSKIQIRKYAKEMADGDWLLNGEPIIFSKIGTLLDGQHRLKAVVKSGETVDFDVRFGIDQTVFKSLNKGKKRSLGDVLSVIGVKSPNHVASTLKILMSFEKGWNQTANNRPVSIDEYLRFFYDNKDHILKTSDEGKIYYNLSGRLMAPSMFSAFLFLFEKSNQEKAKLFMTALASGSGLKDNHPIYRLRSALSRVKLDRNYRLRISERRAMIIKSWNSFIQDKNMKRLRFDSNSEPWPKIL